MNVDKRPRQLSSGESDDVIIIDSDDDQPPRKRQKSETPAVNGINPSVTKLASAQSISIKSTPEPPSLSKPSSDERHGPTLKKSSPWRNRPSWQKPTSAIQFDPLQANHVDIRLSNNEDLSQSSASTTRKRPHDLTTKDELQFDRLSIHRTYQQPPTSRNEAWRHQSSTTSMNPHETGGIEEERESILAKFRLHQNKEGFKLQPVNPLKFNPNNTVPLIRSLQALEQSKIEHTYIEAPERPSVPSRPDQNASSAQVARAAHSPNLVDELVVPPKPETSVHSTLISIPPHKHSTLGPPRPHQAPKFSINVPLSDAAKHRRERKAVQERLKNDVEYAKQNPAEVERLLGLTGFSQTFLIDTDKEKLRRAAQPKKRTVDRSQASLDMGQNKPSSSADVYMDAGLDSRFVHPRIQAKKILIARFAERFEPPLTFNNSVNDRTLNGKFQFVSEYVLRKGVKTTGPIGGSACTCGIACSISCSCITREFREENNKKDIRFEQIEQYERRTDGLVVLRDDFIRRSTIFGTDEKTALERVEISECSEHCSCDQSCINRVVQKGRTVPLEIFETTSCGFGVRSSLSLVRGQFIELYLGEVITDNELNRREEAAEAGSTSYIYSLDWFGTQQSYHIDGENFGSAMRFVNHSCDPNAGTFPVLNNKSTKQLHLVAFFAIKDIPAGTEITIDYTPQAAGTIYELRAADEGMERCRCGAKNCRQMLWLPGKERKARKKIVAKSFE